MFIEKIEAWQYGHVVPEVYHEFKRFGNRAINDTYSWVYKPEMGNDPYVPILDDNRYKQEILIIKAIFNLLAGENASYLVDLSHKKDSPWYNVYNNKEDKRINFIESDKNYFNELFTNID